MPPGSRQAFETGGDIDAFAVEIVAIDAYVAEIDADAEFHTPVRLGARVVLGHVVLNFHGAPYRVHGARKLDQDAIAHGFDDPPAALGDLGIQQLLAKRLEPRQRPGLVLAHEAAVAHHVGHQDCRQPALDPFPGYAGGPSVPVRFGGV